MVKLRLTRMGAKKAPFYRIVATDSRKARDGQYIEQIGIYDPASDPKVVRIDADLAKKWLANGAQPTDTVRNLFSVRCNMLELVEYLVGKLVPEGDYSVELRENGDEADIVIIAAKKDIGKIIGKQGKIARAIRVLVKAASAKSSTRYNVVIEEQE